MEYEILKNPMSIVEMKKGESIRADAGIPIDSWRKIKIKKRMPKGFFDNLEVSFLGGNSFFVNYFIANFKARLGLSDPD